LKSNHHANHHFLVINTHLLYNPTKGNEKLAEIIIIIKTIEKIKAKFSHLDNIHVIFKGDFNFLPSSSLYNFMVDGIFQPN
jgi:mRNA deadenylase 3'-5' endonuclease subunit Ccr4